MNSQRPLRQVLNEFAVERVNTSAGNLELQYSDQPCAEAWVYTSTSTNVQVQIDTSANASDYITITRGAILHLAINNTNRIHLYHPDTNKFIGLLSRR